MYIQSNTRRFESMGQLQLSVFMIKLDHEKYEKSQNNLVLLCKVNQEIFI